MGRNTTPPAEPADERPLEDQGATTEAQTEGESGVKLDLTDDAQETVLGPFIGVSAEPASTLPSTPPSSPLPDSSVVFDDHRPGPALPMHDGSKLHWPNDEQAHRIHTALRGRSILAWTDFPERGHTVVVTAPDGQKISVPHSTPYAAPAAPSRGSVTTYLDGDPAATLSWDGGDIWRFVNALEVQIFEQTLAAGETGKGLFIRIETAAGGNFGGAVPLGEDSRGLDGLVPVIARAAALELLAPH